MTEVHAGNDIETLRDKLTKEKGEFQEQLMKEVLERERKAVQENSNLQAKLSNAQMHSSHYEGMVQKLRSEVTLLKERNMHLERNSALIEQKFDEEVKRELLDRIKELEDKLIKLNEEKKKIKADYDEAVKALEAVDKVYSVREDALAKYKANYEEATDKIKDYKKEIVKLKNDLARNKEKLTRALEYKADREELKDHLRKSKEVIALQKEEIEQVRRDLYEERHDLKMAHSPRANDRELKTEVDILKKDNEANKEGRKTFSKETSSLEEIPKDENTEIKDGMVQKLKREISYLSERNKALEDKVISLNDEKKKMETYNKEAVKALEADDEKVRAMRDTLEKYKADSEKAKDNLRTIKEGNPTGEELERLAAQIEKWKPLGRRLNFDDASLTSFDRDHSEYREKVYAMLSEWKRRGGAIYATYQILYDALCHELVAYRDLAERFCCQEK